jgi:hypothetical protein
MRLKLRPHSTRIAAKAPNRREIDACTLASRLPPTAWWTMQCHSNRSGWLSSLITGKLTGNFGNSGLRAVFRAPKA